MKKKSLLQIFMRNLIRSLLLILLLVIVGAGSYKLTMMFYKDTNLAKSSKTDELIKGIVSDVEVNEISQNLIFGVDKSTGEISKLVLEIFNVNTHNLDYITIPWNTQFTMSNDLYQKICSVSPDIPQIIDFSELYHYFDKDTIYEYGIIFVEDLLEVDISYYTVMDTKVFGTMFTEEKRTITYTKQDTNEEAILAGTEDSLNQVSENLDIQVLQKDFVLEATTMKKNDQLKSFITELYEKIDSNLTLKNKLKYLKSYGLISNDQIYYHGLYGTMSETNFTIEVKESNQLIKNILSNEAYTVPQEESANNGDGVSSVGLNIEILNGSNISGLAASYKTILGDAGYTITGIGNYGEFVLTETKILVNEEGKGRDLLTFFKGANLEKTQLEEGIDIQIILGTADRMK